MLSKKQKSTWDIIEALRKAKKGPIIQIMLHHVGHQPTGVLTHSASTSILSSLSWPGVCGLALCLGFFLEQKLFYQAHYSPLNDLPISGFGQLHFP